MPYKRRSKKYRKKTLAKKVATLAKVVRMRKPELKYSDTVATAQQWNYTPTSSYIFDPLSAISIGTSDVSGRIGDTIHVKSIRMKGTIYLGTASPFVGRFVLILIKQNMEGLLTTANVGNLVMESAYSSTTNAVNAPFDNDNRFGYKVLVDKKIIINPSANLNGINTSMVQARNFYVSKRIEKEVEYWQGSSYVTKNWLVGFFLTDAVASASNVISFTSRVRYTDV